MRVGELPVKTRLAHAGLADDGHDLPLPGARPLLGLAELLQLVPAPHEAREAPGRGGMEARADGLGADDLVELDGRLEALDGAGAQRLHLHVALGETQRVRRDENGAGHGHLFHAGGQMGRLADSRVVHVQVAPDGAHDHLAGVEPDPDVKGHAQGAVDLLGVAPD